MSDTRPIAHIRGAALQMSWRDASKSLTDLIFETVTAALADAGLPISAVDSVVLAAHDLIDGRSLSSMVTAPAAGAYLRDEIRLSDDGLTALSLGAARIEAGESEVAIVATWARASEGDALAVSRASMDPFTQQPLGLGEIDVSAFRLTRWLGDFPDQASARVAATVSRRKRAVANPHALPKEIDTRLAHFPIGPDEGPRWADIFACVVISKAQGPVKVAGVGHGTDATQIGDRDLLGMPALRAACGMALQSAGVTMNDIDLIELDGMTLADEAIGVEALGLCAPGDGFRTLSETGRINRSGGSGAGWCYPAMGLVRCVEAYLRLRSAGKPQLALATGNGGGGAQTCTAVVLEAL